MKKIAKLFCCCGILGWCMEILFTALHSLKQRNFKLVGNTSLLMFPIYGMAVCLYPVSRLMKNFSMPFRGMLYGMGIFFVEYCSGSFLMKKHCCPWDYHDSKWNIHDVIRLDYFPIWALVGLFYEKVLQIIAESIRS